MGNLIKIKHGEEVPTNGILEPCELGYQTGNGGGRLYVGDIDSNDLPVTLQIGRKIFVQSIEPSSDAVQEGDLWVDTSSL